MINSAIILAGGKGERLRPLTNDRPKPMVEVGGKPILEYQIKWLKNAGVREFIIACSYKYEVIEDYFQDGSKWGVDIKYSVEENPLGSGGAILQASEKLSLKEGSTFILNGDNLVDLDWEAFKNAHLKNNSLVTMLLSPLKSPYGIVETDGEDKIIGFKEKPTLPHWINGGIYLFSQEVFELLPKEGSLEFDLFPKLPKEKFLGFKNNGLWRGVDTVKDLTEAEKEIKTLGLG